MNTFLPERFVEVVHRLAAGVEPWDPVRRGRHRDGVAVTLDGLGQPPGAARPFRRQDEFLAALPRLERHGSGRFAQRHHAGLASPLRIRMFDGRRGRSVVPRRLALPIPAWQALIDADEVEGAPPVTVARRTFRVWLHPGAGVELACAAALRGRVVLDGEPLRWVRVEAFERRNDGTAGLRVGRAHGDDRGEFVLVVALEPGFVGTPRDPFPILVRVYGRPPPPVPADPLAYLADRFRAAPAAEPDRSVYLRRYTVDPFWDLPVEALAVPSPGVADPVATGAQVPAGYARTAAPDTPLNLPLGRVSSAPTIEFVE